MPSAWPSRSQSWCNLRHRCGDEDRLAELVREVFDMRPRAIIEQLDLLRPIYQKTAAYGHFGRELPEFTWEKTDKAAILKKRPAANRRI
jgi:S-adenosylmethionine synthetase